jgi:hypothetical protein
MAQSPEFGGHGPYCVERSAWCCLSGCWQGIVHGGMSAMVIDETLGAMSYMLKQEGVLGSGPALTAHLEVDYKKVRGWMDRQTGKKVRTDRQ